MTLSDSGKANTLLKWNLVLQTILIQIFWHQRIQKFSYKVTSFHIHIVVCIWIWLFPNVVSL